MLVNLTIHDFMLIDFVDLEFNEGMTVITGETGSGKSVLLKALSMTLGGRAEPDCVRLPAKKTDIISSFTLEQLPNAQQWLSDNDLNHDDQCLLRRTIAQEGRSRAFINNRPVTLQQLRDLGQTLIEIHSQHAQQDLLNRSKHLWLVDDYADCHDRRSQVEKLFTTWQQKFRQLQDFQHSNAENDSQRQLLLYQLDELNNLDLKQGELEQLEQELQRLSDADNLLSLVEEARQLCSDENGISNQIQRVLSICKTIESKLNPHQDASNSMSELLANAVIHLEEAKMALQDHSESILNDPKRLAEVETRLSAIYDTARKHHSHPSELLEKQQQLQTQLQQMTSNQDELEVIARERDALQEAFETRAEELSQVRQKAAQSLQERINLELNTLEMKNASVSVLVEQDNEHPNSSGIDKVDLLICTNPGQPLKPIAKVASGGELSRLHLAIKIVSSRSSRTPTLIFDEIDSGVGGATAQSIGKKISELGNASQIICITHLAQIASKANNHLKVTKHKAEDERLLASITALNGEVKIGEISRMISGSEESPESLRHAKSMLEATST